MNAKSTIALVGALAVAGCAQRQLGRPSDAGIPKVVADAAKSVPDAMVLPTTECPVVRTPDLAVTDEVDRLLESAHTALDDGAFDIAWTCSDRAADIVPRSIEAHQLRGQALAALGFYDDAEGALTLALAIDPNDPDSLRALADFSLNIRPAPSHDRLRLGLELAQRGLKAISSVHDRTSLRAQLLVLEAQAENDLGDSVAAEASSGKALQLDATSSDAAHERGLALFNLGRFHDAQVVFSAVIAADHDDAYAHQWLGASLDWQGDRKAADEEYMLAHKLAPDDFVLPIVITAADFKAEVDATIAALPALERTRLAKVPIEIRDRPALDDLRAVDPPFPPTILGLYRGAPGDQPEEPGFPKRAIVLYRLNLADAVHSRAELSEQIKQTVLHEIGHFDGQDEDDLRRHGLE